MLSNRVSVMASTDSVHRPARHPQSGYGQDRYNGPYGQQPVNQAAPQHHMTAVGVMVQANAYYAAAGVTPPSPVVNRKKHGSNCQQPPMYSDVTAVVKARAQAEGTQATTHYALSGVYAPTASGGVTPVMGAGEIRFSANPVPAMSQLNVTGQSAETGHQLSPDMGSGSFAPAKKRSRWLFGTRPTQPGNSSQQSSGR